MEKKVISVHAVTIHIYTIAIALLVLLLVILGLKYAHLKLSVQNYTRSTIWMNQQEKPTGLISDYAKIVAVSASQYVSSVELQNYVFTLSKQLHRDIVVLDGSQKILADTISANRGALYSFDKNGEVKLTIADGKTREFEERSTDYLNGIMQIVVPMKNAKGDIIGAVIVSDSQIK